MAYYSPGRYRCQVVGQGFGNSSQKGTPYFYIRVAPQEQLISADHAEPCEQQYERDILMYLTDKTVENVVAKLRHHLGWEGDEWYELDPERGDYVSFDRQVVEASCEHEQDGEKVYERWQLPPIGSGMEHEKAGDCVRSIQAMFGAALKGGKGKAKPKSQKAAREPVAATGKADEDIPF